MARVLFAAPMDAERRAVAAKMASRDFEPVILEDLPPSARDDIWTTADVVVCMGFPREFPTDLREKARKLRLIQALVAGVDHLPFERFPPATIVCVTGWATQRAQISYRSRRLKNVAVRRRSVATLTGAIHTNAAILPAAFGTPNKPAKNGAAIIRIKLKIAPAPTPITSGLDSRAV